MDDTLPDVIGTLVFCGPCGNLLNNPAPGESHVLCEICGYREPVSTFHSIKVTTHTRESAFPSSLRQKRTLVQPTDQVSSSKQLIDERCPKCDSKQMEFSTLQMRSADEGSTVFYTCPRCAYKYSTNN
ncbi:uncharacterized protein L969DRAFT_95500 [Mixia osmundae IAM 14324]|uniref:DNA-directed RNA polymerase subunit n=1 Tax=Mixia osmundae (strain CBS 9802 / IAM 14324 / JCM 22182 / KY 12970) TaxID=764103 RepID=G7E7K9_MIXOS|nr:uncharacterized protein L969DRAFT_95500 [Mixia osmundae IAM 14324]KEI38421.1 hypothetical protein L969DRAFT_95500 [Mixia osmundae IAM 14324]GAA98819.1 hypothetical protein E5Q_05507 [Mixia osmundae IAM 14324]